MIFDASSPDGGVGGSSGASLPSEQIVAGSSKQHAEQQSTDMATLLRRSEGELIRQHAIRTSQAAQQRELDTTAASGAEAVFSRESQQGSDGFGESSAQDTSFETGDDAHEHGDDEKNSADDERNFHFRVKKSGIQDELENQYLNAIHAQEGQFDDAEGSSDERREGNPFTGERERYGFHNPLRSLGHPRHREGQDSANWLEDAQSSSPERHSTSASLWMDDNIHTLNSIRDPQEELHDGEELQLQEAKVAPLRSRTDSMVQCSMESMLTDLDRIQHGVHAVGGISGASHQPLFARQAREDELGERKVVMNELIPGRDPFIDSEREGESSGSYMSAEDQSRPERSGELAAALDSGEASDTFTHDSSSEERDEVRSTDSEQEHPTSPTRADSSTAFTKPDSSLRDDAKSIESAKSALLNFAMAVEAEKLLRHGKQVSDAEPHVASQEVSQVVTSQPVADGSAPVSPPNLPRESKETGSFDSSPTKTELAPAFNPPFESQKSQDVSTEAVIGANGLLQSMPINPNTMPAAQIRAVDATGDQMLSTSQHRRPSFGERVVEGITRSASNISGGARRGSVSRSSEGSRSRQGSRRSSRSSRESLERMEAGRMNRDNQLEDQRRASRGSRQSRSRSSRGSNDSLGQMNADRNSGSINSESREMVSSTRHSQISHFFQDAEVERFEYLKTEKELDEELARASAATTPEEGIPGSVERLQDEFGDHFEASDRLVLEHSAFNMAAQQGQLVDFSTHPASMSEVTQQDRLPCSPSPHQAFHQSSVHHSSEGFSNDVVSREVVSPRFPRGLKGRVLPEGAHAGVQGMRPLPQLPAISSHGEVLPREVPLPASGSRRFSGSTSSFDDEEDALASSQVEVTRGNASQRGSLESKEGDPRYDSFGTRITKSREAREAIPGLDAHASDSINRMHEYSVPARACVSPGTHEYDLVMGRREFSNQDSFRAASQLGSNLGSSSHPSNFLSSRSSGEMKLGSSHAMRLGATATVAGVTNMQRMGESDDEGGLEVSHLSSEDTFEHPESGWTTTDQTFDIKNAMEDGYFHAPEKVQKDSKFIEI